MDFKRNKKPTIFLIILPILLSASIATIFTLLPQWADENLEGNNVINDLPFFTIWIAIFISIACIYGIIWAVLEISRPQEKYSKSKITVNFNIDTEPIVEALEELVGKIEIKIGENGSEQTKQKAKRKTRKKKYY